MEKQIITSAIGKQKRTWFDMGKARLLNVDNWLSAVLQDHFVVVGWWGVLLFPCFFFAVDNWFTDTHFVPGGYTQTVVSRYLEGSNFLTAAILTHSLPFIWGLGVPDDLACLCQFSGFLQFQMCYFAATHFNAEINNSKDPINNLVTESNANVNANINADYICGLIETDGSFTINLSKTSKFSLTVCISSFTNSNNLLLIKNWLAVKGIKSSIFSYISPVTLPLRERSPGTPYSQCSLRISGDKQIERCLNLLETEKTSDFLFCGAKQRDYLLVRAFLKIKQQKPSLEVQAQLLAIKKSMHKENYLIEDLSALNITTREQLETRIGLTADPFYSNSTIKFENDNKILDILQGVDHQDSLHRSRIHKAISNGSLVVSPSFIAGVVDGDGSFYVTVSWEDPLISSRKRSIRWGGCFTLSKDRNSGLLFDLLKYVFKLPSSLPVKALQNTSGVIRSYQMWVRNPTQVEFMLGYLAGKLCGNYRILQYNSVARLFQMRRNGLLENKIENVAGMKDFLREVYDISAISKKGRLRTPPTVEEAWHKTDIWFRATNEKQ